MTTVRDQTVPCESIEVYVGHDNPLTFTGSVGGKDIRILISTGIPYSFIDNAVALQAVASRAGCEVEETEPISVKFVFGGYQAMSRFRCPRFKWMVQGHEFVADMKIVDIKAYDMLLGADWVHHNSPLMFTQDGIFLSKDGKEIALQDKRGSAKSTTAKKK